MVCLVVDVMDWLFPFCAVNLLWLLLSLTVIGFPPATASLFEVGSKAYRGQAPTPTAFLRGVRRWFVPAWLWAGANALLIAAAVLFARALAAYELAAAIMAGFVALVLLAQLYFWPYVMLQETPSLSRALRNSTFTVLGDPLMTGMNLGITLIVGIPSLIIIAPVLFILPVFVVLLYSYSLVEWLDHQGILAGAAREI
jgi:uncharacterized membrane protein YesL